MSSLSRLFVGIDGGQSATKAIVGDDSGRILGRGNAGPCNHAEAGEGRTKLSEAVSAAVNTALSALGLSLATARFQAACCGMSGGPDDKRGILEELLPSEALEVTTDAHIALIGGTGGGPGIVMIAGTGSIALGRNRSGQWARAGGWGYLFGDEGSAFDIVRQALRAALRAEEGWGPPTALANKLLAAAEASNVNELMHWFYTDRFPRSRIASFAPVVDEAAEEGDPEAITILADAGVELMQLVSAVRGKIFSPDERVPIVPVGGVFRSPWVSQAVADFLEEDGGFVLESPRFEPSAGALIRAYELAGLSLTPRDEG